MSRAASRSALLASALLAPPNDRSAEADASDSWRSQADSRRRYIDATSQQQQQQQQQQQLQQQSQGEPQSAARWPDAGGDARTPTADAPVAVPAHGRTAWDDSGQADDMRSMLERQQAAAADRRIKLEAQLAKHRQFLDSLSASSMLTQPLQTQPQPSVQLSSTLPAAQSAGPPAVVPGSSILTSPPPINSYAVAHGSALPAASTSGSSSPPRHLSQLPHPHFTRSPDASPARSPLRRSPASSSDRSAGELLDSSDRFLSASSPVAASSRSGVHTPQTARSTNSFGYDEFALSENVFVLTEKTHRHSRKHSGGDGGGGYSRASSGANSRRDSVRDDAGDDSRRGSPDARGSPGSPDHGSVVSPAAAPSAASPSSSPLPAAWSNQMDAFLSSLLPADPSPGRRQQQQQNHRAEQQLSRSDLSPSPVSPPHSADSVAAIDSPSSHSHQQGHSPSAHNDSLNTSNLSRQYLPHRDVEMGAHGEQGAGADLFALATVGLDKRQPRQQQQQQQQQLQQQHHSHSHPSHPSHFDRSTRSPKHDSYEQDALPPSRRDDDASSSSSSRSRRAAAQPRLDAHSSEQSFASSGQHAQSSQPQPHPQPLQQQQPQKQHHSPPLHPSASLHPADLYDATLSAPANYALTEHTRSDQYRPQNAAVPNAIPQSRSTGSGAGRGKATGALGKSVPRAASRTRASSKQHPVPILSVTQSVPARAMAAVHRDDRHGGTLPRPAVAAPSASATPFSELYASHMAAAEREESERISARDADDSAEWHHDLDEQELVEEEPPSANTAAPIAKQQQPRAHSRTPSLSLTQQRSQPPPPPHPQQALQASRPKESASALSGISGVGVLLDDEAVVEAQLQRIDRALEVQKLRDEIKQLRSDSDHRDLFAQYENTIAALQSQNANLRTRLSKAECAAAADAGRPGSSGAGSPPPVAARAQAQLRTLEHSYRRVSEELASLNEAHAALRKRERHFAFQTRQLHALEARLADSASAAARRDKEIQAARSRSEAERAATEELKSLLVDMSHKHAAETERANKQAEQARALRGEVERLAAALHDTKAAAVMQGLAKQPRLPKRVSPAVQRFDGLLDVSELESLFLEQRRADTPPNLVNIANRKGLELLTRLRAKVDALHRDHLATQNNEKQLLMLVLKLQEKKASSGPRLYM